MKTARITSTAVRMGMATSEAAEASTVERGDSGCWLKRWARFSTMITAASTSRPTAMARPPRVMAFRPSPAAWSGRAAPKVARGSTASTGRAARKRPSRATRMPATRTPPSSRARDTPFRACLTRPPWS